MTVRKEQLHVQTLHQSVEDFVLDPRFKQLVLGERALITKDNGDTFLAKAGMLLYELGDFQFDLLYHVVRAEWTTGRSLRSFLDDGILFPLQIKLSGMDWVFRIPLEFAAFLKLKLWFIESLQINPTLFSKLKGPFLSCIGLACTMTRDKVVVNADSCDLAQLALEHGYQIKNDPSCLLMALERTENYQLALFLAGNGAELNPPGPKPLDAVLQRIGDWRIMAPFSSRRDRAEEGHLTTLFSDDSKYEPSSVDYRDYQVVVELVARGADFAATSDYTRAQIIRLFERQGWPTERIRDRLLGRWIDRWVLKIDEKLRT